MSAENEPTKEVQEEPQQNFGGYIAFVVFAFIGFITTLALVIAAAPGTNDWKIQGWFKSSRDLGADVPLVGALVAMAGGFLTVGVATIHLIETQKQTVGNNAETQATSEKVRGAVETYAFALFKVAVGLVLLTFFLVIFADYEFQGWKNAISFFIGAMVSCIFGYFGLKGVTHAGGRTAALLETDEADAFRYAFRSATTLGFMLTGAGLLFLAVVILVFQDAKFLIGYVFGLAVQGLFARVGGFVYDASVISSAKASAVHRAAGAQVSDGLGAAADGAETFVTAVAVAALIGLFPFQKDGQDVPFILGGISLFGNLVGSFLARGGLNGLAVAQLVAAVLNLALAAFPVFFYHLTFRVYLSYAMGIIGVVVVRAVSQFNSSVEGVQTKAVEALVGKRGAFARAFASGLFTAFPVVVVLALITVLSMVAGDDMINGKDGVNEYTLAIAVLGFVSVTPLQISAQALAPIAATANAIAPSETAASLAATGQAAAATTRGTHIASVGLLGFAAIRTFIVWVLQGTTYRMDRHDFSAAANGTVVTGADFVYRNATNRAFHNMDPMLLPGFTVNMLDKRVFAGLVIGAAVPLYYLAGAIFAGQAAEDEDNTKDEENADANVAFAAAKRTIVPFFLAISVPCIFGFGGGTFVLTAVLFGAVVVGTLIALLIGNAGAQLNSAPIVARSNTEAKPDESVLARLATAGNALRDAAVVANFIKVLVVTSLVLIFAIQIACNADNLGTSYCYSNSP